jgi:hypothetical protein
VSESGPDFFLVFLALPPDGLSEYRVQNTHAGTRSPLGPTIMPDGVLVVGERSIGRSISRTDFESIDEDKLKFGLRMFSIEKDNFLDCGELDDDEDISEEDDEYEPFKSCDTLV